MKIAQIVCLVKGRFPNEKAKLFLSMPKMLLAMWNIQLVQIEHVKSDFVMSPTVKLLFECKYFMREA